MHRNRAGDGEDHLGSTSCGLGRPEVLVILCLRSLLIFDRHERCQSAEDNEEHDQDHGEDDQFLHGGVLGTVLAPLTAALAKVFLELVATEFVIYKTRKRDSVSEELQGAHGVAENNHGGHYEENIFKDTR